MPAVTRELPCSRPLTKNQTLSFLIGPPPATLKS